jgi:hypothetical protein
MTAKKARKSTKKAAKGKKVAAVKPLLRTA